MTRLYGEISTLERGVGKGNSAHIQGHGGVRSWMLWIESFGHVWSGTGWIRLRSFYQIGLEQFALDSDRNFGPQSDRKRFIYQNTSIGDTGLIRKVSQSHLPEKGKDPYFIIIFIE